MPTFPLVLAAALSGLLLPAQAHVQTPATPDTQAAASPSTTAWLDPLPLDSGARVEALFELLVSGDYLGFDDREPWSGTLVRYRDLPNLVALCGDDTPLAEPLDLPGPKPLDLSNPMLPAAPEPAPPRASTRAHLAAFLLDGLRQGRHVPDMLTMERIEGDLGAWYASFGRLFADADESTARTHPAWLPRETYGDEFDGTRFEASVARLAKLPQEPTARVATVVEQVAQGAYRGGRSADLRFEDLPALIATLDDDEPCGSITSPLSSFLPRGTATRGEIALCLIDAVRTGQRYPLLVYDGHGGLSQQQRDRVRAWWATLAPLGQEPARLHPTWGGELLVIETQPRPTSD